MLQKVYDYMTKHRMVKAGDKIIAGVSGGADSMCLLLVLEKLKERLDITVTAVHVHHGLRGADADGDEAFVREFCSGYGITYRSCCFDVNAIAREEKLSVEEAGRKVRYRAFEEVREAAGADKIAVAHNLNDNAETLLHHLFRGTGVRGMGGIRPVRGRVIRPLLGISRVEIEAFLKENNIGFRTDKSNFQDVYTRNKIRRQVLAYAEEHINPEAVLHTAAAAEKLQQAEAVLEELAENKFLEYVSMHENKMEIGAEMFRNERELMQGYILRLGIKRIGHPLKDITTGHIQDIAGLSDKAVGRKLDLPGGLHAERGYEQVFLYPGEKEEDHFEMRSQEITVPGIYSAGKTGWQIGFTLEIRGEKEIFEEKRYTKWFDYDKIRGGLRLRTREAGDYLVINASGNRKKLKSYFIDQKIPREERERILLLADGNHILWVIGYRISEAYKVGRDTKNIMRVHIDKGEFCNV